MSDYKLVPFEPTPEMVSAAADAYMPFGDMDLALRMAILAAPAVQGEPQPAEQHPEAVREGAPYDDPAFSALCREHEVYGTAAAAMCAVFWEAGKRVAEQQPALDVAGLVEALEAVVFYHEEVEDNDGNLMMHYSKMLRKVREALAAHRKQGGEV